METKFSFFTNVKSKEVKVITLNQLLQLLESEKVEELVSKYKSGKIKKEELPAFTPGGVFDGGHSKSCFKYGNGIVHLDIDGLEVNEVDVLMKRLAKDDNILLAFRSVSGRGVKVFARYKGIDYSRYEKYVLDFMQYFGSVYTEWFNYIDVKCKDLSRLCFISFDPKYVYHDDAIDLELLMDVDEGEVSRSVVGGTDDETVLGRIIELVKSRGIEFIEGSRNRFINQVVWYSCRAGIKKEWLLDKLISVYSNGYSVKEINAVVNSVYSNCGSRFGEIRDKFVDDVSVFAIENYLKKNGALNTRGVVKLLGNVFKCWLVIDDKDNRNNRYIYCLMDKDNELVPISNEVVNDLLKSGLREMGLSADKIAEIMAVTKVDKDMIDRISVDLYLGSELKFVFSNKVVLVGDEVKVVDKSEYNGYYLKKYVFGVDYIDGVNECIYSRFVLNAVGEDNFELARLIIGYILSQDNNAFRGRAVLLMDSNVQESEDNNANGGTGKGLFCKGLEMMLNSCKIDAKKNSSGQFDMQNIKEDTRLIIINDVKRSFNFERLYNAITDGLEIERKHEHPFVVPPSFGYKFVITSNYLIPIRGESDKRRRIELTFSDYYNSERTPFDEFGELFNWNDGEWSRFYSWMVGCILEYKSKGFKYMIELNKEMNRVLHEVSEVGDVGLYKWITDKISNEWNEKNRLVVSDMYRAYLTESNLSERQLDIRVFSRRIKAVLKEFGFESKVVKINGSSVRVYVKSDSEPTFEDVWGDSVGIDGDKDRDELDF